MDVFFFNDTATTEIYTLSLHDALPIFGSDIADHCIPLSLRDGELVLQAESTAWATQLRTLQRELRSEEHTSELQSRQYIVCRLLLEKNKHSSSVSFSSLPAALLHDSLL